MTVGSLHTKLDKHKMLGAPYWTNIQDCVHAQVVPIPRWPCFHICVHSQRRTEWSIKSSAWMNCRHVPRPLCERLAGCPNYIFRTYLWWNNPKTGCISYKPVGSCTRVKTLVMQKHMQIDSSTPSQTLWCAQENVSNSLCPCSSIFTCSWSSIK